MEKSENIIEISKALLSAQKKIIGAIKNAENPFLKSEYADLKSVIEAVKPSLNEYGIVFMQAVNMDGAIPIIETMLLHESGQFISSKTPVYCTKPNDPQAFGSGITYSKRYALQALLGLPTEDDDGNAASKEPKQRVEITDAQQVYIDQLSEKLTDSVPVGMTLDIKKLSAYLYGLKGSYPDDLKTVGVAAAYIVNGGKIKNLCKATK
jgi:hypothetical protein